MTGCAIGWWMEAGCANAWLRDGRLSGFGFALTPTYAEGSRAARIMVAVACGPVHAVAVARKP
jgi:hypothetical protein